MAAKKPTWHDTIKTQLKKYGKPKAKKTGLMDQWAKKRTTVIDKPYKKK